MTDFKKFNVKRWWGDIRFWILLLFFVRLVGITNPPLETGHNWRQSLTNMVARNFHENGLDLLHPMVDYGGARTGIIGTEFPLFNAMIAVTADVFGYEHWYGRLINLIVSSIGLYFFFLLVRRLYSPKAAFYATLVLAVSIWFAFSRKIMPDTFSISLVFIGFYYGLSFLDTGKKVFLIPFLLLTSLGILCKIPSVYLFSLIGVVAIIPTVSIQRKILVISTAILSFLIASIWYFYWVPHLVETYHFQLYFSKGLLEGWNEIRAHWGLVFEKFYFSALHSLVVLVPIAIGLFVLFKQKRRWILISVAALSSVFFLFVLKAGENFPMHNYYIIPFAPVLAFIAGVGLSEIPVKFSLPLILIICLEGIGNQNHDFFLTKEVQPTLTLSQKAKEHLQDQKARVVINGGDSPTDMYFLHRKGWSYDNATLAQPHCVDSLHALGAKYLIITHPKQSPEFRQYTVIYSDSNVVFYGL